MSKLLSSTEPYIFKSGKSTVRFIWCLLRSHPKACLKHCSPSFLLSPATNPFGAKGKIQHKGLILRLVRLQGVFICLCLQYGSHCAESREKHSPFCRNVAGYVTYFSPFLSYLCLLFLVFLSWQQLLTTVSSTATSAGHLPLCCSLQAQK